MSTTSARHSRLKSSTTTSTRKRRPLSSVSATKSRLQRWLAPCGKAIGDRVPRTVPRDTAGTASCGQHDTLPAQQDVQPPIAEAPSLPSQGLQSGPHLQIFGPPRPIAIGLGIHADQPIFPNLAKEFVPDRPDQLWGADITYIAIPPVSSTSRSSSMPGHAR